MAKKEPRRVKTLSEFIEWAAQFRDGRYLFRGVSNDAYKIEASAYRRLREADRNNPSKLLKINQELIEKARGRGHDQKNGQRLSDLELLAELQHFGAATCLIDFTRSALVALWFACQQSAKGEANGKVFAVRSDDPARLKTVNPELIKKDIDHFLNLDENDNYLLYQWDPKLQNNRIIAQHSVFLFSGAQIEAEAECVIIKSSKQDILTSLDKISDIAEESIYPDFDGFARVHAHDKPYIEPNAHGYLRRGIEAQQNNNLDDAIAYYTEVIRLEPDPGIVANACYNRGVAYRKKGDYDRAIADYTKAIELNPYYANAYNNRGVAYRKKGDYDRAIADYTKVIELQPNYAIAYINRGAAYGEKGDYDRAIADFIKAIELNPYYANAYNNRGVAYRKKGDYDRAIADYTKAIELNPYYANAYNNRGVAWLHLQAWEKAQADLTTAKDMGRDITASFHNDYTSVPDFERRNGVKLPADLAAMLL